MAMTPQQIQEKHFHDSFRGYSHEEVDLFLDEVAEAFERLYRENQTLQRRITDVEEQLERAASAPARTSGVEEDSVSEGTLKRMLVIAQETADKAVQEARMKARATLERAEGKARELEEQARARADGMIANAENRVRELGSATVQKQQELERAKEALAKFDRDYRARFRQFIESQLDSLDDFALSNPRSPLLGGLPVAQRRATPEVSAAVSEPDATQVAPVESPMQDVADPDVIDSAKTAARPIKDAGNAIDEGPGSQVSASRLGSVTSSEDFAWKPEGETSTKSDSGKIEAPGSRKEGTGGSDIANSQRSSPEIRSSSGSGAKSGPESAVAPERRRPASEGGSGTAGIPEKGRPDRPRTQQEAKSASDAEDDRLIRELFWGED